MEGYCFDLQLFYSTAAWTISLDGVMRGGEAKGDVGVGVL